MIPDCLAESGPWLVDDELLTLPLLDLAADLSALLERFEVALARFPEPSVGAGGPLNGLCVRQGAVVVVLLDAGACAAAGVALESVWAHELAHALDDIDGRVRWSASRRNQGRRERFADRLGALLLDEQPTTVGAARPLMAAARQRA